MFNVLVMKLLFVNIFFQDGQNNNAYVPYLDYSKDFTSNQTTISNGTSPIITNSSLTTTSLDLRYSATYGNPYLRVNHNVLPTSLNGGQPPPPPPYTTLRNGTVPQLQAKLPSNSLQYIIANKMPPQITNKTTTQATHVQY